MPVDDLVNDRVVVAEAEGEDDAVVDFDTDADADADADAAADGVLNLVADATRVLAAIVIEPVEDLVDKAVAALVVDLLAEAEKLAESVIEPVSVLVTVADAELDSIAVMVDVSVLETVDDSVREPAAVIVIGRSVKDSVEGSVNDAYTEVNADKVAVLASELDWVKEALAISVGLAVTDSVKDAVEVSVGEAVEVSVKDAVEVSVNDSVADSVKDTVEDSLERAAKEGVRDVEHLQQLLHDHLGALVYERLKRRPMVLPVVVEV